MLERILLPLDGSATAEAILVHVRQLLKRRDAEVILARAVERPTMLPASEVNVVAEARFQAKRHLAEMTEQLAEQGVRVRSVVREGPAAETILEIAAQERATLIAMSTHGRTGLARWTFGSVTEKLLRASDVPVLVVRSFERGEAVPREERGFRKILVTVDGSRRALAVVPHVVELAKLCGSTVLVLHVKETPLYPPGSFAGMMVGRPLEPPPPPAAADAEDQLRYAADRIASEGLQVATLTSGGDPATQILEIAGQKTADLIAMTTHGRTGVARWVLGSVTEKVLRAATVPMLVVRNAKDGEVTCSNAS